jgi:hypothetical protein
MWTSSKTRRLGAQGLVHAYRAPPIKNRVRSDPRAERRSTFPSSRLRGNGPRPPERDCPDAAPSLRVARVTSSSRLVGRPAFRAAAPVSETGPPRKKVARATRAAPGPSAGATKSLRSSEPPVTRRAQVTSKTKPPVLRPRRFASAPRPADPPEPSSHFKNRTAGLEVQALRFGERPADPPEHRGHFSLRVAGPRIQARRFRAPGAGPPESRSLSAAEIAGHSHQQSHSRCPPVVPLLPFVHNKQNFRTLRNDSTWLKKKPPWAS